MTLTTRNCRAFPSEFDENDALRVKSCVCSDELEGRARQEGRDTYVVAEVMLRRWKTKPRSPGQPGKAKKASREK